MRAATSIMVLVTFLSTAGVGRGLWRLCDEGSATHIESAFAPCCPSGDPEGREAAGDSDGEQVTAEGCGACVHQPALAYTLPHVAASDVSVRSLAFASVTIVFDFCNNPPTDLASVLRTSPWMTSEEAPCAPVASVVLRC